MFFRAVVAGFALSLGILLGGVAAQSSPTSIDNPALVSYSVKVNWCQGETDACVILCDNTTKNNTCDPNILTYSCICGNGTEPGLKYYKDTLPDYVCQESYTLCSTNHTGDSAGQQLCKDNIQSKCGFLDLSSYSPSAGKSNSATTLLTSASSSPTITGTLASNSPPASNIEASTTPTSSAPSTSTPVPESSPGLSDGAKIGIGVGVPVIVILLGLALFYFCHHRRRKYPAYKPRSFSGPFHPGSSKPSTGSSPSSLPAKIQPQAGVQELGGEKAATELDSTPITSELHDVPTRAPHTLSNSLHGFPLPLPESDESAPVMTPHPFVRDSSGSPRYPQISSLGDLVSPESQRSPGSQISPSSQVSPSEGSQSAARSPEALGSGVYTPGSENGGAGAGGAGAGAGYVDDEDEIAYQERRLRERREALEERERIAAEEDALRARRNRGSK